jgi:hypothetical protein
MDAAHGQPPITASDKADTAIRGTPVTLLDGTVVDSWCEEWRHECEARTVLAMQPLQRRRDYLYGALDKWGKYSGGVKSKRGEAAVKRLEETMLALWSAKRAAAKASILNRPHGAANDNEATEGAQHG